MAALSHSSSRVGRLDARQKPEEKLESPKLYYPEITNSFGDMLPDFAIQVYITYCVVF